MLSHLKFQCYYKNRENLSNKSKEVLSKFYESALCAASLLGSIFIKFKSPVAQYARESECYCALLTVKGFNRCAIRLNTLVKCSIQIAMKWYFVSGFTAIWSRQLNPDNPDNGWPITLKQARVGGQSGEPGSCTANGRMPDLLKIAPLLIWRQRAIFFVESKSNPNCPPIELLAALREAPP